MSIFTDSAAALAELQNVRLAMIANSRALSAAATGTSTAPFEDGGNTYLSRKLQAAEAEVARKLGVFLEPTTIFPVNEPTDDQVAALGGGPWAIEPAYDMPPGFVSTTAFPTLQLLQRPIASVSSIKVIYPATNQLLIDIPLGWVRLDRKHGQLTIAPSGLANSAPVSIFALQAFYLGDWVPEMIWIQYVAGLPRNDPRVPDVCDLILRLAALRTLLDRFVPQSGSISADGLSRSVSQDLSKHQEAIDDQLADLRESINGLIFGA